MDINEHLAINVMGWEKFNCVFDSYWAIEAGMCRYSGKWDPRNNIAQAFMCANVLRKTMSINITLDDSYPYVMIKHKRIWEEGETLAYTLSTAIAKATGWEEQ